MRTRPLILLLAITSIPAWGQSTGAAPSDYAFEINVTSHWRAELLFRAPVKLSGCAIGDVDPTQPGAEVVAVGGDGSVFVVSRRADGWVGAAVYQAPGELIQVAIGDALPDRPGNEIIAVGKAEGREREQGGGATYLILRTENGWQGEIIARSEKLTHGVCIRRGEVIVTGYDKRVVSLVPDGDGWRERKLVDLPGPGKNCLWTEDALAVACSDGSLVKVREAVGGITTEVIDQRERGRGRLGTDGKRLVVSDDDGVLSIIEGGKRTELHRGTLRQRGAVLADLVPGRAGLECATAGYDRMIRVFLPRKGGYDMIVPYVDQERFHHLAMGNLDDDPAIEIVACSFAGNLVLVEHVGLD